MQHLYSAVRGWLLPLLAVLLLGTGPARAQTAATKLYWVQSSGTATDDRLVSANPDGSGQATLASGNSTTTFANPNALWVDAANGVIYVGDGANSGTTGISRFTSGGVFVNTIVAGVAGVSITGLHVVGSKLYWVQSSGTASDDRLVSANLDGSGVTVLASGASSFDNPNALWVDAATGVIYVGDGANAATTGIRAFNLSGTLLNTIVPGVSGTGINALQVAGSKLYWVQSSGTAANDQLASVNLDGTNKAVLASGNSAATFANPNSLRVDVPNGVIYVGDGAAAGSTGISRFSLTGTFLSTIVAGGGLFSFNGLATNEAAAVAPTVTTAAATTVSATSAVLGGNVTADGGATVTDRGVVYSTTNTTPTTSDTKVPNGTGIGTFSQTVTGLATTTTYYVRAYAINSVGTSYGSAVSFTTTAAPMLANIESTSLTFIVGSFATQITSALTASDADSPNLTGATVRFATGFVANQDFLNFTNQNGISGSYNTGTGVLTMSGTASLAAYQVGLRSIRYSNSAGVNATVGARLVTFVVSDGTTTSNAQSRTINVVQPTAAPAVTAPGNGTYVTTTTPTYTGAAMAGSTVTVYVDGTAIGTTTADGTGNFTLAQPTALAQGSHPVYATAQASGSAVSANSATNTFTVDTVQPTVAISSTAGASGNNTTTTPIPFAVTFSENVTGFVAGDITVTNGTISGFTAASGTIYTFTVTPTTVGTATTVNVPANVAQDAAGNQNTGAAAPYSLTFVAPTITVAPATLPNGTTGVAYSQTLTASGGTAPYSFAVTAGALPAGLTLSSAGTLSGTPTAGGGTFTFTATATDNSAAPGPYNGSRTYSLTIAPAAVTSVTWTGNVSTDWFTAGNWTPNTVPTATISATIPTAPSGGRFPAITTALAQVLNLSLNSGATLTQTGGTLMLAGNLTNNGTFALRGGTVDLGSTALSSILGSSNTRFFNLTVGASGAQSSTSASTSVQLLLTLNGNFTTNGNSFTLESNAANTALVVNNSGVITGNATFQRYISPATNPGLGYRHYSAPVSNATVASLTTASFTPVVNPNYNTSATPNSVQPFPTVYYYDQARLATSTNSLAPFDKGWKSPSALTDPLTVGKGYTVNLTAGQTLAVTGPQNNGSVTQSLSRTTTFAPDAGWQLLGNPFPSPLDYSLVAPFDRIGLDQAIYIWASNSQYNGSYRAYVNGVGGDPILAQGQGFFARVSTGQTSGTLSLRNSHRVTSYQNPVYQRGTANRPLVQLDLQGATQADPLYVYFENGATVGVDPEFDAVKLPNSTGLNLAAWAGNDQLAINGLPLTSTASVTVPLFIGLPVTGTYTLHAAQVLNFGTGEQPFLRDLQLGTLTDLSLHPDYTFTMNAANTTPRFELVFGARVLGVASAKLAAQVGVYPNPATTTVFVELPAALGRVAVAAELVDALGRTVRTQSLPAQGAAAHRLDLANLATGLYTLHLATTAGVVVKKLVVE
ncbi:Ig-like domain-containing protein [Hymenobacter sp. BT770]|uniref:Ig-like domain-containing protein n=1 Tax=Hymenobacter sp. BT770 TaxID=2886942 RepID=UPI001D0FF559|nr:Ig-like domain-containing protein [Hymenobacter sp. BT770]MCC3155386.1 Ig-like domain-containing protein [Hymenobacter sp. BT770]MDO3417437.1 Ig-like domain-containing protein [Hymenobacter sp. BT770]